MIRCRQPTATVVAVVVLTTGAGCSSNTSELEAELADSQSALNGAQTELADAQTGLDETRAERDQIQAELDGALKQIAELAPHQVLLDAGCSRMTDPQLHWDCPSGANLASVNLYETNLTGANLADAIGYP
jgi:uncharacterized protein YjbI with pentapeptide repeats